MSWNMKWNTDKILIKYECGDCEIKWKNYESINKHKIINRDNNRWIDKIQF